MNEHQLKRESSDTFGRNTRADIELLRRMAEEAATNRGERMLGAAVVTAVLLVICVGAIFVIFA